MECGGGWGIGQPKVNSRTALIVSPALDTRMNMYCAALIDKAVASDWKRDLDDHVAIGRRHQTWRVGDGRAHKRWSRSPACRLAESG